MNNQNNTANSLAHTKWNSTNRYRRVIWQCNGKFKGEHKYETSHFDEEIIKARFVDAFNSILADKNSARENCRLMQTTLTDCTGIDVEIKSLLEEIDAVTELTKRCIAENSQTAQDQEEYIAQYNGFVERYEKAKAQVEKLHTPKAARRLMLNPITHKDRRFKACGLLLFVVELKRKRKCIIIYLVNRYLSRL